MIEGGPILPRTEEYRSRVIRRWKRSGQGCEETFGGGRPIPQLKRGAARIVLAPRMRKLHYERRSRVSHVRLHTFCRMDSGS
jgi:hypothetical protein